MRGRQKKAQEGGGCCQESFTAETNRQPLALSLGGEGSHTSRKIKSSASPVIGGKVRDCGKQKSHS